MVGFPTLSHLWGWVVEIHGYRFFQAWFRPRSKETKHNRKSVLLTNFVVYDYSIAALRSDSIAHAKGAVGGEPDQPKGNISGIACWTTKHVNLTMTNVIYLLYVWGPFRITTWMIIWLVLGQVQTSEQSSFLHDALT